MIRRMIPFIVAVVALVMSAACSDGHIMGPVLDDAAPAPTASAIVAARAAAALGEHPTHLRGAGTLAPLGWCDEGAGVVRFLVQGEGTLGHVGRFHTEQTACRSMVTGAVTDGEALIVAANGDHLYATWTGQALDPATLTGVVDAVYEITGGTGRFADAAGVLEIRIIMTTDTTWTATGSGWTSY